MRKHLLLAAVGACAVLAPSAYGEMIQIQYQITGAGIVTCSASLPGPAICANSSGPLLAITQLDANSNSPGSTPMDEVTSDALSMLNVSSASQTIQIQISANDFSPTTSSETLLSHIGGTVLIGGAANSLSFQSCVDPSNALRSVGSTGIACTPGSTGSGVSAPSIAAAGSFDNTQSATVGALSSQFTLSESYIITLAAGAQINWSASTTLEGAAVTTPEPNSMALAGLGLLGFGLLLKRIRRQA